MITTKTVVLYDITLHLYEILHLTVVIWTNSTFSLQLWFWRPVFKENNTHIFCYYCEQIAWHFYYMHGHTKSVTTYSSSQTKMLWYGIRSDIKSRAVNICHLEEHQSQQKVLIDWRLRDVVTPVRHRQRKKIVTGTHVVVKQSLLRVQQKIRILKLSSNNILRWCTVCKCANLCHAVGKWLRRYNITRMPQHMVMSFQSYKLQSLHHPQSLNDDHHNA